MKLQIVTGSTRPNRKSLEVAEWVAELASERENIEVELVDIADYDLPLLDEPMPPSLHQYTRDHTKRWSDKIAEADAYIFVTPEYNHSIPAALKNAIDFLKDEWANKSVGFVGYGSVGGARAIEHLRGIAGELQMADVRQTVMLSLFTDFENFTTLKPQEMHLSLLETLLDQVIAWGAALQSLRVEEAYAAA